MATSPRVIRVVAAGGALVALLGACARQAAAEAGGPVAFVTADPNGGDAALLQATVEVGARCVVAVAADGTRYLPVFYVKAASGDGTTLTWDGRTYRNGDDIQLGGGASDVPGDADYVPDGCEFDAVWFVST